VLLAAAGAVHAQETTGGLKGVITDQAGKPVASASVTIVHTPTGVTVTTTTDSTGYYMADHLRVGGPYKVSVMADSYKASSVTVPVVGIGQPTEADIALNADSGPTQVVVRAARRAVIAGRTRVGSEEIAAEPTLNRDIRDYALKSPTAWEDSTNSGAISLGGMNNRANAILIDGVRQGDDFGLNANGLPTLRSPISVDALEAVSVDTAPYDVQYDNFQGGVINFVTKSGGNDFHGGLFYEKTGNDMRGKTYKYKSFDGSKKTGTVSGDFSEKTYGLNFSGPIVKDHLFFFVDYEKFQGESPALYGPGDSNAPVTINTVKQADVDRVVDIMKSKYNYDPLSWNGGSVPYTDEKYFVKLDWQINDKHRVNVSYQDTKSQSVSDYDNSTYYQDLALQSHWYSNETDLKVYKLQALSDWTDTFSTEFNYSRKEVSALPKPLGGTDFAEFDIQTPDGGWIYLGPDRYRHYNILTNNNTHIDLKARYRAGHHNMFFGYEHETVDVFNAFVANSNGTYKFTSYGASGVSYTSGIDALAAGDANSVYYSNAYDNVKADGAASFTYKTDSFYGQDEWRITPRFTLTYGLRYDRYTSKTPPLNNPTFAANYGFPNTINFDGLDIWQPRVSFNWRPEFGDGLQIYGGVGKFQGGQANVWVSNSYSNTGNILGAASCSAGTAKSPYSLSAACKAGMTNVDGFNVSQGLQDMNASSAAAGTGSTNALAPDFEIPSVWKASLGVAKTFDLGKLGNGYRMTAEYQYTKFDSALYWYDYYQQASYSGAAPDGRPEFFGTTPNGAARANRQDIVLGSVNMGDARQLVFTVSKAWNDGIAKGLSFDWSTVFQHSTDANSGTSSTASSDIKTLASSDINTPALGISNYQIDRMTKLTLSYQHKFFGDNTTGIYLYAQKRSGYHYSFTFDDTTSNKNGAGGLYGQNTTYAGYDTELLYVPKADSSGNVTLSSDPIVTYKAGFDISGFNQFLKDTGLIKYAGTITPRNAFKSPSTMLVNLRITQELPAISPRWGKLQLYVDVQNLGNMINPYWGNVSQYGFPYVYNAVNASNCQAIVKSTGVPQQASCAATGNFYQYNSYTQKDPTTYATSSVYQIKVGVNYKF
jgi:outer membrane receptor protein involved in Fe transport